MIRMKGYLMKFIIFLNLVVSSIANAGGVPVGEFDCSQKKGAFHISILDTAPGFFLKVDFKFDNEASVLEGQGLLAKQVLKDGSSISRIMMPGSNFIFFFDDQGRLGLEKNDLNCRKL